MYSKLNLKEDDHTEKITRGIKSSSAHSSTILFTPLWMLYRDGRNLLSLYDAVNGTSYENEEELEVVILEDAVCLKIRNDAAFVIDSGLNLYEQRASANPNMPLRDLYYWKKCESLRGYMIFVEKARDKKAAGIKPERAVSRAVEECIFEGIFSKFFSEHKKETVEMVIYEFDQEVYDRVLREGGETIEIEKGIETGRSQGIKIGKVSGIMSVIENLTDTWNMTVEQAMAALKVPESERTEYMENLKE